MFDAATVTVQITKCHSLITFSRANSSFVFLSRSAVCVAPPLVKAARSHHRHVDYTRATFGPLHTFVSSSFIFLSHFTFLLGRVLFLGSGKYLTTTEESLQISDPCFFQLAH